MIVYSDGRIEGSVGGGEVENRVKKEALEAMGDGRTRKLNYSMNDPEQGDPGICGGTLEIYIEPILPKDKIIVIGVGHVGREVVKLAKWLGYTVLVSDDREELCTPDECPGADLYINCKMNDLPSRIEMTPKTFLVLATRGSDVDIEGLPKLIISNVAYIGVIGSRKRWQATKKGLLEKGIPEEKISRIHSPIGLELNAETPAEIALSIMAEIIMIRNQASGRSMSS